MPPKKSQKAVKMDLNSFLTSQEYGGNWADDVELPTAPAAAAGSGSVGGPSDHGPRGEGGDFQRYDRAKTPLPIRPPFTAFLGNLSYEVSERDIETFFGDLPIKNVRIPNGGEGKRGFGYVEFEDLEALKEAIKLDGQTMMNRRVKIDVAGERTGRDGDEDQAKFATNWRQGPRATPTGPALSSGGSYGGDRDRGFGGHGRIEETNWRRRPQEGAATRSPALSTSASVSSSDGGARRAHVNPFGAAKPREEKISDKKADAARSDAGSDGSAAPPVKKSVNPFGAAKPVVNPFGAAKPREEKLSEKQEEPAAGNAKPNVRPESGRERGSKGPELPTNWRRAAGMTKAAEPAPKAGPAPKQPAPAKKETKSESDKGNVFAHLEDADA